MQAPRKSPVAPPGKVERSAHAVETAENRRQMIAMAKVNMAHAEAGNAPSQVADVMRVPAQNYLDVDRWEREVAMFKRLPLLLALGGELRGPASYKAITVMEVPVLLTRDSGGDDRHRAVQRGHQ